jgi:hypothetical protein
MDARIGVLIRLEPGDAANAACRSESCRIRQIWTIKRLGSAPASKTGGTLTGLWIETYCRPPIYGQQSAQGSAHGWKPLGILTGMAFEWSTVRQTTGGALGAA